jgi:putative PIN family toxin of toxin-antitoxin system
VGPEGGAQGRAVSVAPLVVPDTNVVLSALVFRNGVVAGLRVAWQAGRIVPLADRATAGELLRVLAYPKFGLSIAEQEALLADYLPWCRVVAKPRRQPPVPPCRDAADLPFLQLAVAGKADFVVTGDKALLAVRAGMRCKVVEPAAFMRLLR